MKLLRRESRAEGRGLERSLALVASGPRPSAVESRLRRPRGAFTLLEVIIACAIFFMVAFAIMEMVTRSLAAVKSLQKREPDPGIVLHYLSISNIWEETPGSGDYEDIAPGMYPGYSYEYFPTEIGSNGLWEVYVISHNRRNPKQTPSVVYSQFYSPMSKPGSATKGGLGAQ